MSTLNPKARSRIESSSRPSLAHLQENSRSQKIQGRLAAVRGSESSKHKNPDAAGEEEAQKVNTKCKGVSSFGGQFIFIQFCNKFLFLNGFSYFVIILE